MSLRGGIFSAVLFSAALFSTSALAEIAYTTGSINVRTGPSAGYARVATLPAGADVDVGACSGGWCRISTGGIRGWVSARYLSFGSQPSYSSGSSVVIIGPGPDPFWGPGPFWGSPPYWRHRHHWGPRPFWGGPRFGGPGPVLPPRPVWGGPHWGGPHFGPGPAFPHGRPWGIGR
ncbi:SH3 domain-containing protein [Phyllobacteriaceae bacterium JZ32]